VPWPQAEGPTVLGSCQGPSGFLGKGGVAAPGLRPRGFAARASKVSCPRPDRINKDSLLGSADGGPMASGPKPGAMGFPRRGPRGRTWSSGLWRTTPRPEPEHVPSTGVAVLPGGPLLPRLDRTSRDLPHGSALAANRDPRVPGRTEEPPWIPPNQQSIHPLTE